MSTKSLVTDSISAFASPIDTSLLQQLLYRLDAQESELASLRADAELRASDIRGLQDEQKAAQLENDSLKERLRNLNGKIIDLEMDREEAEKRISQLENPTRDSPTNKGRAEKIREYLQKNGQVRTFADRKLRTSLKGRCSPYETLRGFLACDKWQLNRAIGELQEAYPGEYVSKRSGKNWLLVELPKL